MGCGGSAANVPPGLSCQLCQLWQLCQLCQRCPHAVHCPTATHAGRLDALAMVQWCSDAAGVLDANRPAEQLGRRSSALGRFGSFTRHPLLVPNGIAARRPCHRDPCPRPDTRVDTTFPSLSARMYCGPPPSSPRRFSGLVVPGPPSLKYALHLGGITSQVDPAHGMLHK